MTRETSGGSGGSKARPASPALVVALGASAGGLASLEAFFAAVTDEVENTAAFVVVQHLAPDRHSLLAELLAARTEMRVREATDGMELSAGTVTVIPPGRELAIASGRLSLTEPAAPTASRHPVSVFFRSLALDQKERAVAIVLSGGGSDGTEGARAVKAEGGLVIAQNPESAEHPGMPRSLISAGLADSVLPPAEMPARLEAYLRHAGGPQLDGEAAPGTAVILPQVCQLVRERMGHDFSHYKGNTLGRRLERRMALQHISRPEDYLSFLQENRPEIESLFHDLLIGVTNFFRDPAAYEALRTHAIPKLLASTPAGGTFRVWVCGCSTGEEAYSLAIMLLEELESRSQERQLQMFATDIDPRAIQLARTGVYPASIAADVSEERLSRFFSPEPGRDTYRVQKSLRDLVVFSLQDVTRDPPFSRVDLISCRNLLIYLNGEMQKRVIPVFHYALKAGGALFLGSSESVGEFPDLFTPLDLEHKVFLRGPGRSGAPGPILKDFMGGPIARQGPPLGSGAASLRRLTEEALVAQYGQPAVLVDERGRVLYVHGSTGNYLELARGEVGADILSMAREGLSCPLRVALRKAAQQKEVLRCPGVTVHTLGVSVRFNLIVRPVKVGGAPRSRELFLVVFEEAPLPSQEQKEVADLGDDGTRRVADLQQELITKEEYLQATHEEMRTSNEELQHLNDALHFSNEALQSANEELETSREELQSVNEELGTVNSELQGKVADLSRANNDLNNLLAGTGVATLFVDLRLRVTRFTPSVTAMVNLLPTDIGRPLAHITANLVDCDIEEDAKQVLEALQPREREVQTRDGSWFLLRTLPYRTAENAVEGAVLTFVDITERRQWRERLREQTAQLSLAQILVRDMEDRIVLWTGGAESLYGYSAEEAVGQVSHLLLCTTFPVEPSEIKAELRAQGRWQGELTHRARDGSLITVASLWTLYRGEDGTPCHVIESNNDITRLRQAEDELRRLRGST